MKHENDLSERSRSTKYKRMMRFGISIVVVLSLTVSVGIVFAKYKASFESNYQQADANNFFFTSDFLSTEGKSYTILCSDLKTATIDFKLFNHEDSLNYSNSDITYKIEYNLHEIKKEETGTIAGNDKHNTQISYQLSNFGNNAFLTKAEVTVTASAISPYKKVLKGTFTLVQSENDLKCSVTDRVNSNAGTVTVTTGGLGGTVNITIPDGCIFDPTNTYPTDYSISGNTLSFSASSDARYSFVYLKENPQADYTNQVSAKLTIN